MHKLALTAATLPLALSITSAVSTAPAYAKPIFKCDGPTRHASDSHTFKWIAHDSTTLKVTFDTTYKYCHPLDHFYSQRGKAKLLNLRVTTNEATNVNKTHETCGRTDAYEGLTFRTRYFQSWTVRQTRLPELITHCAKDTTTEFNYSLAHRRQYTWKKGWAPRWDAAVHVHLNNAVRDQTRHLSGSFDR